VAQAANSRRDVSSVVDAVAGALEKLVPIDVIGVVTREAAGLRPLGAYFRSAPRRPGETALMSTDVGRVRRDPESIVRQP
jgi:hypothetical protein